MIVSLDLDNTLLEWQDHWAELYYRWFGVVGLFLPQEEGLAFTAEGDPFQPEVTPLDQWDACLKYTHFDTIEQFYAWYDKANGWATQPWTVGAQGFLYELDQTPGINYRFVTARPTVDGQEEAMRRCLPWGGALSFCNNQSKHTVKADIWVDDAPEVLESLAANGKKAIRFAQPWNEGVEAFAVANSWAEVLTILKENQ